MNQQIDEPVDETILRAMTLDDRLGPAKRLSAEESRALIFAAMEAANAVDLTSQQGSKRPAWPAMAIAAALLLFLTTGATAAYYFATRARPEPPPAPQAVAPVTAPALVEPEDEVETADTLAEDGGVDAPAPAPRRTHAADDLLEKANRLRGEARWRAAERAYLDVRKKFPRTHAAYVATIAAAALRLEHLDDPRRALALYQIARRTSPNGVLDADILFGIAGARRELHDLTEEKRALEELIRSHPSSVFANGAKRRLGELEGRSP